MKIKTFIFDFDGVILDTERLAIQAWTQIYTHHQIPFPMERWIENIGTNSVFDPYRYLIEQAGLGECTEEIDFHVSEILQKELSDSEILPGVREIIGFAKSNHIRLAIGTNSPLRWLERMAGERAILDLFDVIVTARDVKNTKPEPDIFIKAAYLTHARPAECIVFEDSHNGLLAAKAAGAFCVINNSCLLPYRDFSAADLIVDKLSDLNIAEITRCFSALVPDEAELSVES